MQIDALNRLRNQASLDRCRRWHPGQQPSDAEQIINYIDSLEARIADQNKKLSGYNWQLNPDRMGQ